MGTESGIRNMTAGSPFRHILMFTLPLLAGNFLQQFYNMVDSWVVGNYVSDGALAAVGVGFPVIFLFTSLFSGIATGGTVVIAQSFGGGRPDRVRSAIDSLYTAFIRSILPITAAALLLVNPLMTVLRVDPAAWAETRTYLLVVCAGLVGSIGYNLNAGILGGMGNSSTTLLFLAVSTILNIFLDLALVLAVPLGVLGVALGTVIAQLCSWLFGIWYINRRYPQLAIHPFNGIFDRKLFCEIIRIGLPSGIQMSLVALGAMGVLSKVNSYGKAFTAGFNVGNKLDTLSFLPVQSLAAAVISFVGQNMGASREDRVRQGVRITVTMAVVWTVLSSALVVWLSVPLSRIFSPDPAVIAASARYLQCVMPPYVLFAILFVLNSAMRGAGDSLYPMVNVVASVILLRVPFLYLLANRFGPDAMYWSYGIGWAVACALSVYHYAAGKCSGTVSEINPFVDENGLVSVRAKVNGGVKLFDGMNVRVSVKRSVPNQYVVPKTAVVLRTGKQVIFTLKDGKAMWNYVTTGLENMTEYTLSRWEGDGIKDGAQVIVTGNVNLAHEAPVEVIP